jgi:hypothetical protein
MFSDFRENACTRWHVELFLEEGYLTEIWQYEDIGSNHILTPSEVAIGGILDLAGLSCPITASTITQHELPISCDLLITSHLERILY